MQLQFLDISVAKIQNSKTLLDTRYLKINRKLYVVDETFLNDLKTLRRISATVIRLTKMSENLVRIHLTRQGGFM